MHEIALTIVALADSADEFIHRMLPAITPEEEVALGVVAQDSKAEVKAIKAEEGEDALAKRTL